MERIVRITHSLTDSAIQEFAGLELDPRALIDMFRQLLMDILPPDSTDLYPYGGAPRSVVFGREPEN